MGGNALKTLKTHRLSAVDYAAVSGFVVNLLQRRWPDARPHLVRSVRDKADFGDMDVIVDRAALPTEVEAELRSLFACREIVRNGPVYSCDVDGFQLDLVCMPTQHYSTAIDYFAYNDAGNLMGRVARRLGFKYGHAGLSYQLREGDYLVDDIEVTRDMAAAFAFLGYDSPGADYLAHQEGFDSLQAMFRFVSASRYFDPSAYALEQRNHIARTRDRKRPSYRAFLEWLAVACPPAGPDAGGDQSTHIARAELTFPQFAQALAEARTHHALARDRRARFNGKLVQVWTGLEGRELGALMGRCRTEYSGGQRAFDVWVLEASPKALQAYVLDVHRR